MIQRSQTVYLFLALVCLLVDFLLPLIHVDIEENGAQLSAVLTSTGIKTDETFTSHPLWIMYALLSAITLFAIISFKNRKRQLALCRALFSTHLLIVAGVYLLFYFGEGMLTEKLNIPANAKIVFSAPPGFYLLLPPAAFYWLAIRGIKRDEALLKSIDRLR